MFCCYLWMISTLQCMVSVQICENSPDQCNVKALVSIFMQTYGTFKGHMHNHSIIQLNGCCFFKIGVFYSAGGLEALYGACFVLPFI